MSRQTASSSIAFVKRFTIDSPYPSQTSPNKHRLDSVLSEIGLSLCLHANQTIPYLVATYLCLASPRHVHLQWFPRAT
ncbi:hypothetical protein L596_020229 [Steinernema carpocapsae]|uniref:Uncharacterized protein n=1 Tax=Steinernema carpocapsae TaxID=34508 RepID=A0A4V6A104_STECR|nr:hypothetical protein L596_020229 [Steinernema carpocapsae]